MKKDTKIIFGDSRLVLESWSKGFVSKEMPPETIALAQEVRGLREKFEQAGGKIRRIAGGANPADLGYHKE